MLSAVLTLPAPRAAGHAQDVRVSVRATMVNAELFHRVVLACLRQSTFPPDTDAAAFAPADCGDALEEACELGGFRVDPPGCTDLLASLCGLLGPPMLSSLVEEVSAGLAGGDWPRAEAALFALHELARDVQDMVTGLSVRHARVPALRTR